jgi:hypothetical protein
MQTIPINQPTSQSSKQVIFLSIGMSRSTAAWRTKPLDGTHTGGIQSSDALQECTAEALFGPMPHCFHSNPLAKHYQRAIQPMSETRVSPMFGACD